MIIISRNDTPFSLIKQLSIGHVVNKTWLISTQWTVKNILRVTFVSKDEESLADWMVRKFTMNTTTSQNIQQLYRIYNNFTKHTTTLQNIQQIYKIYNNFTKYAKLKKKYQHISISATDFTRLSTREQKIITYLKIITLKCLRLKKD